VTPSIWLRYGDTGFQKFWGHDLDISVLRDVIGHVTISLVVVTFLLVVNDDRYGYST